MTLREKCPNTEFFLVPIFLYYRIQENTDQKNLRMRILFRQCEGLKFMSGSQPNGRNKEGTGMDESKKQVAARFTRLKKAFGDPLIEA